MLSPYIRGKHQTEQHLLMNVTTFIAKRYIRPRRLSFVGIIGLISVFGIVVGTAALILVMSLFNGFRGVANTLMTAFGPHIRITNAAFTPEEQVRWNMQPTWTSKLVVQAPSGTSVIVGQAFDESDSVSQSAIRGSIVYGSGSITPVDGLPRIVVSLGVAQNLQIVLGDTITMYSPQQVESSLAGMMMSTGARAIVGGVFQTNSSRDIDASYVFMGRSLMTGLTGRTEPSAWEIRMLHPEHAKDTAAAIRSKADIHIDTWEDLNRGMFDTMKLEQMGSFIVLVLIIVVAAFNIVISLTMGVVEKRADILVLRTMGCTDAMIRAIYLKQGLAIGIVSVILGTSIGIALTLGQQHFQWVAFDMSQGYLVPALPMTLKATDIILVSGVGLALSTSAAIYPAIRATRRSSPSASL